jgi:hypothetical protein
MMQLHHFILSCGGDKLTTTQAAPDATGSKTVSSSVRSSGPALREDATMTTLKASVWGIAVCVLVICAVHPVTAQTGYIGVYLDNTRTTWCASGTPPYQVDMWVWALVEGDIGLGGFEFGLTLPPDVEVDWHANPDVINELCYPGEYCPPQYHGTFSTCMKPGVWIWLEWGTLTVNTNELRVIELIGYPESGVISLWRCDNTSLIPTVLRDAVYLSPDCVTLPTRPVTWGAIKALFED